MGFTLSIKLHTNIPNDRSRSNTPKDKIISLFLGKTNVMIRYLATCTSRQQEKIKQMSTDKSTFK